MRRAVHIVLGLVLLTGARSAASPVEVSLGLRGGWLGRADLARAVAGAVRGTAERAGSECSVEIRRAPDSLRLPHGRWTLRFPMPSVESLRGMFTLPVEVRVDNRPVRQISVGVLVRTFADVVVAVRPLTRHQQVGDADLCIRRAETTLLRDGACTDQAALLGQRTTRIVAEGSILYPWMLEPVPVVRSGEQIRLIVRAGAVTLSAVAVAKEDGLPGDRILVQRSGGRVRLRGTVAKDGSVAIDVK